MQVEKLLSCVIYVGVLGTVVSRVFLREVISMEKTCVCRSISLPRQTLLSPVSLRQRVSRVGLEEVNKASDE